MEKHTVLLQSKSELVCSNGSILQCPVFQLQYTQIWITEQIILLLIIQLELLYLRMVWGRISESFKNE